jgi:hypothetical protein
MPKYKLMRKVKGTTSWRTCSLHDGKGRRIPRGETEDKTVVLNNKAYMDKEFPNETYAVLEI